MIQLIVLNPKFVAKVLQIFGIYKDLTVKNKMHLNFYSATVAGLPIFSKALRSVSKSVLRVS